MRAKRGTKRVCHECAVRFYDLSRDPIVCPSCGAHHAPAAIVEPERRAAPLGGKTGWRARSFKRPDPDAAPETVEAGDAPEGSLGPAPSDDVVLDEEADETDVSGLIDHESEPKEG